MKELRIYLTVSLVLDPNTEKERVLCQTVANHLDEHVIYETYNEDDYTEEMLYRSHHPKENKPGSMLPLIGVSALMESAMNYVLDMAKLSALFLYVGAFEKRNAQLVIEIATNHHHENTFLRPCTEISKEILVKMVEVGVGFRFDCNDVYKTAGDYFDHESFIRYLESDE